MTNPYDVPLLLFCVVVVVVVVQYVDPEGFEFSIRTPGTPPRWQDYDKELSFIWDKLSQKATTLLSLKQQQQRTDSTNTKFEFAFNAEDMDEYVEQSYPAS